MTNKKKEIKIEVPKELNPIFSNLAYIQHKDDEFVLMFLHETPMMQPKAKAIITLTPGHAKKFLNALNENVKKYEQNFGAIKIPGTPKTPANTEVA